MVNNKIGQINVAPSDAATTVATLIDAKQIAVDLDAADVRRSDSATIQLDDNPTSGSYQTVSLFQCNLTGVLAEIWFGAIALRSTAVTTLTGYS